MFEEEPHHVEGGNGTEGREMDGYLLLGFKTDDLVLCSYHQFRARHMRDLSAAVVAGQYPGIDLP